MGRSVYATIADLRAAGLSDESAYTDTRLMELLIIAAAIVESVTGKQYFGPVKKTFLANGEGRRLIEEPNRNRIIEIESVTLLRSGILRTLGFLSSMPAVLDADQITVQDRLIRLRPTDTSSSPFHRSFRDARESRLPHDDKNVEVVGVFGTLDLETKFETVLSADLAADAVAVLLDDTGDIEKNDLLLIDGRFWVIADSITTASQPGPPIVPGTVKIDKSPKAATAGVSAIRYGKVPILVRQAVVRTALAHRHILGSEDEQEQRDGQRIRREETDSYEIEFFAAPGGGNTNAGTGDPIADVFLSDFRAPAISARWV